MVKVKDYRFKDRQRFFSQIAHGDMNMIQRLVFKELDWKEFGPLVVSYRSGSILPLLNNNGFGIESPKKNVFEEARKHSEVSVEPMKYNEVKVDIVNDQISVKYNSAKFHDGFVTFRWENNSKIKELSILNERLRSEYDIIKRYFAKVRNKDTFEVDLKLHYYAGGLGLYKVEASSKDIDTITDTLETVKEIRTVALAKAQPVLDKGQILLTADEIYSTIEKEGLNIFKQTENQIIEVLINQDSVKHKEELNFLAVKLHSLREKIRFTQVPLFGFVFYYSGRESHYYIWELLNSHATYVWTFPKIESIATTYVRLESCINIVQSSGRNTYRRSYKAQKIDSDIQFRIFEHSVSFEEWKGKIVEYLK